MINVDDFILAKGEIEFLRKTFGERAEVYPNGGHLGNFEYRDNIRHMLEFLGADAEAAQ